MSSLWQQPFSEKEPQPTKTSGGTALQVWLSGMLLNLPVEPGCWPCARTVTADHPSLWPELPGAPAGIYQSQPTLAGAPSRLQGLEFTSVTGPCGWPPQGVHTLPAQFILPGRLSTEPGTGSAR